MEKYTQFGQGSMESGSIFKLTLTLSVQRDIRLRSIGVSILSWLFNMAAIEENILNNLSPITECYLWWLSVWTFPQVPVISFGEGDRCGMESRRG